MSDQWLTPRWETQSTAFKDCDSTLGVWNDPPRLTAPADPVSPLAVGRGNIRILDDASIAGISALFDHWRGKRVACLMDEPSAQEIGPGYWESSFSVAGLIPRYLFQAGIPCRRIYPSEQSGFTDENRLHYWPVATTNLDVIIWVPIKEGLVTTRMKALTSRFPLIRFVENGGELYLGGAAHSYVPYLMDNAVVQDAWIGIQHLALYADPAVAGIVSDKFAQVQLADASGVPLAPLHWSVEHDYHGYGVTARYPDGLELRTWVGFLAQDRVALEWCLVNAGGSSRTARISLGGDFGIEGRLPVVMSQEGSDIVADLSDRLKQLARLRINLRMPDRISPQVHGQGYDSGAVMIQLAPGAEVRGMMAASLAFAPQAVVPGLPEEGIGLREQSVRRRVEIIAGLKDVGDVPHGQDVLQKAVATILGNTWQAPAGLDQKRFGRRRIVQVQRFFYPLWAPYEAGFYASGVRHLDPELARDQMSVVPLLQNSDGWIPIVASNQAAFEFQGWSMVPSLAFGTWQTYQADPQVSFLDGVYASLCRNIEWWYAHRQPRGDGVFGFAHAQEGGGDDHPRADECSGALRSGMKNYLSPDACGFILMEMQCLLRMAEVLNRTEDQAQWRSRIGVLKQRAREVCYDPRDNMFYDVEIATNQFRRNISPWHFVPLWAGIPLDKDLARDMIRRHLLEQLMGSVPFPIVSRDDPAYLPDVYWRGPSWPQLWLIMLQTLCWHGFQQEADRAADQLVNMCHQNPYIMEIYDSQLGQGISLPQYSFAAATLLEIVLRRYRDDPPWR